MSKATTFRQSEITRAVKGVLAAGIVVAEIVATRDGVRIVTADGARSEGAAKNPWDEVLADGEAQ